MKQKPRVIKIRVTDVESGTNSPGQILARHICADSIVGPNLGHLQEGRFDSRDDVYRDLFERMKSDSSVDIRRSAARVLAGVNQEWVADQLIGFLENTGASDEIESELMEINMSVLDGLIEETPPHAVSILDCALTITIRLVTAHSKRSAKAKKSKNKGGKNRHASRAYEGTPHVEFLDKTCQCIEIHGRSVNTLLQKLLKLARICADSESMHDELRRIARAIARIDPDARRTTELFPNVTLVQKMINAISTDSSCSAFLRGLSNYCDDLIRGPMPGYVRLKPMQIRERIFGTASQPVQAPADSDETENELESTPDVVGNQKRSINNWIRNGALLAIKISDKWYDVRIDQLDELRHVHKTPE